LVNHITYPKNPLATLPQGLNLGIEYLGRPSAQDIKKTDRAGVESLSSSAL